MRRDRDVAIGKRGHLGKGTDKRARQHALFLQTHIKIGFLFTITSSVMSHDIGCTKPCPSTQSHEPVLTRWRRSPIICTRWLASRFAEGSSMSTTRSMSGDQRSYGDCSMTIPISSLFDPRPPDGFWSLHGRGNRSCAVCDVRCGLCDA